MTFEFLISLLQKPVTVSNQYICFEKLCNFLVSEITGNVSDIFRKYCWKVVTKTLCGVTGYSFLQGRTLMNINQVIEIISISYIKILSSNRKIRKCGVHRLYAKLFSSTDV